MPELTAALVQGQHQPGAAPLPDAPHHDQLVGVAPPAHVLAGVERLGTIRAQEHVELSRAVQLGAVGALAVIHRG